MLIGTFTRYPAFALLAACAMVLSAIYILWLLPPDDDRSGHRGQRPAADLVPRELVVVAPLIALLLVLGVYPNPHWT